MNLFFKIKEKFFKNRDSNWICILEVPKDSIIPKELEGHLTAFPFGIFPLDSMSQKVIPVFLEYRKNGVEIQKNDLKRKINNEKKNLEEYKNNPKKIKDVLQKNISNSLSQYVSYNENINNYIFSEDIPLSLKDEEITLKKEISKFKLERIEFYFSEIVRNSINEEKLRRIERKIPDSFFNYVYVDKSLNSQNPEYFFSYQEDLCLDNIFVYSDETPDEFRAIAEEIKSDFRYYNYHYYVMKNPISFPSLPDELLDYIDYTYCDIFAKENIPVNLVPVFEKYKKEFDETKNKILERKDKFFQS